MSDDYPLLYQSLLIFHEASDFAIKLYHIVKVNWCWVYYGWSYFNMYVFFMFICIVVSEDKLWIFHLICWFFSIYALLFQAVKDIVLLFTR